MDALRMQLRDLLIIFFFWSSLAVFSSSQIPSSFLLEGLRGRVERNLISFQCTNAETAQPAPDAIFMLNGTELGEKAGRTLSRGSNPNTILFQITREFEGSYSCGFRVDRNNIRVSDGVLFIGKALPGPFTPAHPQTFVTELGSKAVLNCSISPGCLIQRYFVTWTNGTSGRPYTQNHLSLPPINTPTSDPRYTIDPSTLSLRISNVEFADADSNYICILGVSNPPDNTEFFYNQTRYTSLGLFIYKRPVITAPPISTVIPFGKSSVSFSCRAEGFPSPIITWRHAGHNITSSDNKYFISFNVSNEGKVNSSVLTLMNPQISDTGMIECLADASPNSHTVSLQLAGAVASIPFTVLGEFATSNVFITTTRNVIFSLTFPTILHPVQLRFRYHEVGGEKRSFNATPPTVYNNTVEINYFAPGDSIPDKFRVEIFLLHGSVVGPGKDTMLIYDKTKPSDISGLVLTTALPSVLVTGVVAIIMISVICLCFTYHCKKSKNKHEETNNKCELESELAKHEQEIAATQQAHSNKMEEMDMTHWHKMEEAEIDVRIEQQEAISSTLDTLRAQLCKESNSEIKKALIDGLVALHSVSVSKRVREDGGELCSSDDEQIDSITEDVAEKFSKVAKHILELGFKNEKISPHLKKSVSTVMKELPDETE